MKTITLSSPIKAFLFAFIMIVVASFTIQQVYAQTAVLTSMPTTTDNATAKSVMGFQSTAFPIGNAGKVQVIFQDPTGNGASVVIRNKNRNIVYSKNYQNKETHMSNIDLSPLPDGAYTVEVIALSKAGLSKEKYSYNFNIQSTFSRSITPINKELEKKLFIPKHYQVRR